MNVDDTGRALAGAIRRRRTELGFSQRRLAAEMVAAGCRDWTGSTVAGAERLDKPRSLSVDELAALCAALRCSLDDLLRDMPQSLERLRGGSRETESTDWSVDVVAARRWELREELEDRLATSLGISVSDIRRIAADLYGHDDVLAVRDSRLSDVPLGDPSSRAKRLGHVTRDIRRELADYLEQQDLDGSEDPEPPF